jgi:hypothetical protein
VSTPAQPEAELPSTCALCGAPLDGVTRCRACGLYQQMGARRPNPFTHASLWLLAGMLIAVYVVALVIVSMAR